MHIIILSALLKNVKVLIKSPIRGVILEKEYLRNNVLEYAYEWAYKRNPAYYNYDKLGGDCTNFVSQCIYAGSKIMNYTKTFGWYYINANNKSPSWTGIEYLYNYFTRKSGVGPIGKASKRNHLQVGDFVQLSFSGDIFAHTLLVTNIIEDNIYVTTHTFDNWNKLLDSYIYKNIRYVHIETVVV